MLSSNTKDFLQAAIIGGLAGSRTSSAPAVTSILLSKNPTKAFAPKLIRFLGNQSVSQVMQLMAIPELIMDKVPTVGDRITPMGVACRMVSGTLCGALLFRSRNQDVVKGMLIGGLAALLSTYALFYTRKKLAEKTQIPDALLGTAEDAIVVAGGKWLVNSA
ncbi:DUF4126 family protein [Cytophagaceae bacterium YF14B1]|uniref:DUF4126 family protein n=1 Tax=Xanthocytophaga flava TaxID=3048013 RepID=A0AAE3U9U4_9BACT|nr:DUF4126 family protein [Xanthocytophaga flavus]MDJ1485474.1 DUF4126 family protein [Xanthocytophaga flavus]